MIVRVVALFFYSLGSQFLNIFDVNKNQGALRLDSCFFLFLLKYPLRKKKSKSHKKNLKKLKVRKLKIKQDKI